MSKPFSQSCENNKGPILERLILELAQSRDVLEIGSGTGQHAVHFAAAMPQLLWQTSDLPENHAGISLWLDEAGLDNIVAPISLDVGQYHWGSDLYDAVFTANSLHIMAWEAALHFVSQVAEALTEGGRFIAYGPFNYAGQYTSDSNRRFDQWLKQQNPLSAIRDFEQLDEAAGKAGMTLWQDYPMPANNRLLVWRKWVSSAQGV